MWHYVALPLLSCGENSESGYFMLIMDPSAASSDTSFLSFHKEVTAGSQTLPQEECFAEASGKSGN